MARDVEIDDIVKSGTKHETKPILDEPKMFRVIMHNDHYTTMDFVVEIIIKIFNKQAAEATRIMLDIHNKGKGICGIYTYDIAITKILQVHNMAMQREFPLKCSCEAV